MTPNESHDGRINFSADPTDPTDQRQVASFVEDVFRRIPSVANFKLSRNFLVNCPKQPKLSSPLALLLSQTPLASRSPPFLPKNEVLVVRCLPKKKPLTIPKPSSRYAAFLHNRIPRICCRCGIGTSFTRETSTSYERSCLNMLATSLLRLL